MYLIKGEKGDKTIFFLKPWKLTDNCIININHKNVHSKKLSGITMTERSMIPY
jgi:hypothetical protein